MNKERRAMLEMLLCAVMWSLSGVLTKLVALNPFVVSAVRSLCAAVVILVFMRVLRLKLVMSPRAAAIGACVAAIFFCYLPAIRLTTAANAIVLQYTAPIYVLVFGAVFYKQKIKRPDILAVLLTAFGIALCFFGKLSGGSFLGNMLALISGVFLAAMFLLVAKADERERLSGFFYAQVLSILVGLPFVMMDAAAITGRDILLTVLQGVVQLGLPYVLYARAVRHCPALTCSLISVIEPIANPLWVFLAVGESPGMFSFIGSGVVLATVTAWCVWGEKQKRLNNALPEGAHGV